MVGESFLDERSKDSASPMKRSLLFEGSDVNFLSFDIETYSPNGFPFAMEDPIVNFSLVAPWTRKGLFSVSFLAEPLFENEMLSLLYKLLRELEGCFLLTYNGTRFDLPYTIERGRLYGLDFAEVFPSLIIGMFTKGLNVLIQGCQGMTKSLLRGFLEYRGF